MVGNGIRKLMERAAPDADEMMIETLLSHFRSYYDEHCTDTTLPYPGIPELLHHLTDQGIKVAVATNKYQAAAEKIVEHYFPDIEFAAILGQVSDRPPKPDPSIVFAILNITPTPKAEVAFVGDSAVDIETARRACVSSIGVTWGFRPVGELRRAYAEHMVSNADEIYKLVTCQSTL